MQYPKYADNLAICANNGFVCTQFISSVCLFAHLSLKVLVSSEVNPLGKLFYLRKNITIRESLQFENEPVLSVRPCC